MDEQPTEPRTAQLPYTAPYPDGGDYVFRRWKGDRFNPDELAIERGCEQGHRDRDEGRGR